MKTKQPNKKFWAESNTPLRWTLLLLTSYSSNIVLDCLTPQKKPPSTLFSSLKRGEFSRDAFYRQWQQHRELACSFNVLCFCCFPLHASCGWSSGAEGSTVALAATRPFCMSQVCTTLHLLVSAWVLATLQALLLLPPAGQRHEHPAHWHLQTIRMVSMQVVIGLFCAESTTNWTFVGGCNPTFNLRQVGGKKNSGIPGDPECRKCSDWRWTDWWIDGTLFLVSLK